eukprot:TRINITY_DN3129_c0_g1_i3.p3 TRINITY_DN3129_c0_g1~~TRINITY_DN3129_c0_g1_i3.p3  ORF type:complete len:220 (-),score=22.05 TRINITY_DN3129_c0_g1_i3:32-691(-)
MVSRSKKSSDLPRMVGSTKPGTKSTLTVFRRGSHKDLSVVIAEIETEKPIAQAAEKPGKAKEATAAQALGLIVSDLTDADKKELGIKGGVQVDAVDAAAARSGLREGDVILAVANVSVVNVKELETVLVKLDKAKAINVLFRRGEWAQYTVKQKKGQQQICLLYTSDAADDMQCVDLGGRRIIKKKKIKKDHHNVECRYNEGHGHNHRLSMRTRATAQD